MRFLIGIHYSFYPVLNQLKSIGINDMFLIIMRINTIVMLSHALCMNSNANGVNWFMNPLTIVISHQSTTFTQVMCVAIRKKSSLRSHEAPLFLVKSAPRRCYWVPWRVRFGHSRANSPVSWEIPEQRCSAQKIHQNGLMLWHLTALSLFISTIYIYINLYKLI